MSLNELEIVMIVNWMMYVLNIDVIFKFSAKEDFLFSVL